MRDQTAFAKLTRNILKDLNAGESTASESGEDDGDGESAENEN